MQQEPRRVDLLIDIGQYSADKLAAVDLVINVLTLSGIVGDARPARARICMCQAHSGAENKKTVLKMNILSET